METKSNSRPRWNPWPISIIAFFTVAIIGCGSFIAFCNLHPADLVASDYYEQEVRYQGQIDRMQRVQQQAPLASVKYEAAKQLITVALPARHALAQTTGKIQLYRPSETNLDRELRLEPDAKGVQAIDASHLLPGLWKVRVSWTVDRQGYFIDQSVIVGPKTS